jgi:ATP-dependent helicase/nuclease subunit A
MSDPTAADAAARERALDIRRSFIVQAPAGSGKTTVLTQRYLRLLASVDEPEQVLAITFTRKAAGEMRERVRQALDGQITARTPADALTIELATQVRDHAARRGWGIDESAARLRIQTIDSFNSFLAHSLPITSRSGFSRGVTEDPADLYRLAARETMRFAEAEPALRQDLERVLRRLDDDWMRLEELIAGMFARRAEWLPNLPQLSGEDLATRIEAGLAEIVGGELVQAAAALGAEFIAQAAAFARHIAPNLGPEQMPAVAAWLGADAPLTATVADLPRWRGLAEVSLRKGEDVPRARFTKSEGIRADDERGRQLAAQWKETLESLDEVRIAALATLRLLPEPRIPDRERRALDSLANLLLAAATQLTALFNSGGECDYPEIAGAARHALTVDSSPTPLAERLGARLQHILVDEFQDTSREQYDLLVTLTQDWSAGDGRTLFLVGDPMQSIYGFRNAEVGRFSTVRDGGLGVVALEPLELRRNFRSAPAIVHWCNETFARVFPAADDARSSAVRHLASVAARALDGTTHVRRVVGDDCARSEADDVARRIAALRRDRPADSIAVLASVRLHLRAARRALQQADIPFVGVKLEPLADVAVARDLEALTRALDAPLDRIAWLAVLRAPFVGLSLVDLTAVSDATRDGVVLDALIRGVPGLSPEGVERLLRAGSVLLPAWRERELEPRAHLVERVWLALGGAATCAPAELAHARRFLTALSADDERRLRGHRTDLEHLMSGLYADDAARPGAVSLMTIHGAKGLEFDHVFVLGVGRPPRADEPRLLNWLELPRAGQRDLLLMAPIRSRGEEDEEGDAINRYLRRLLRKRAAAERARQAYVALTRARCTLHVYVHPRMRGNAGTDFVPNASSLLENLWPALGADIGSYEAVAEAGTTMVEPAVTQLRRRIARTAPLPQAPPDVVSRGEIAPVGQEEDEDIEFSWARQTARRVGTVVHEELERFARAGLPAAGALPTHVARIASRLRTLGVEAEGARAGADRALRALEATLADPRGRWLFDATHREARSELALSGVHDGRIVNVVIDRTFVAADGTRWIVDFKSSPHEGGDLERFLDAEVRRYGAQLRRYARLARELGPEPVRAGLYFPLLGAWREVDVGDGR